MHLRWLAICRWTKTLNPFRWDKVALFEEYYMDTKEEKATPTKKGSMLPGRGKTASCEICISDIDKNMMTGMECGHFYCNSCWCGYLTAKIVDNGAMEFIPCPAPNCEHAVEDPVVFMLVQDKKIQAKYKVSLRIL